MLPHSGTCRRYAGAGIYAGGMTAGDGLGEQRQDAIHALFLGKIAVWY